MYLLCADVGPVHPTDFSRTRQHPRPEAGPAAAGGPTAVGGPPAGEAERVFETVERNLTTLTRTVPMAGDRGSPTVHADSHCWGTTDLGPSFSASG
jgi:hypothetical protein